MYQTVFDIRETSALSLILYIFWMTALTAITLLFIVISYNLRQQGRFGWRWFLLLSIVVITADFTLISFFYSRSNYIEALKTGHAQLISGMVKEVRKSKVEYVTIDNREFIISGPAEITPAFTEHGILKEGQDVRVYFKDRYILRLEIKQ